MIVTTLSKIFIKHLLNSFELTCKILKSEIQIFLKFLKLNQIFIFNIQKNFYGHDYITILEKRFLSIKVMETFVFNL